MALALAPAGMEGGLELGPRPGPERPDRGLLQGEGEAEAELERQAEARPGLLRQLRLAWGRPAPIPQNPQPHPGPRQDPGP